jgi:penicillin-binding protein 2
MTERRGPARNTRILFYRGLVIVALLVLVGQLGRLQLARGAYYQQAADVNRFRLEANPAPRGVVYDRRGYLLVRNMPQLSVAMIPGYLPEDAQERLALLKKLAALLDIPLRGPLHEFTPGARSQSQTQPSGKPILEILKEAELAPYRPVLVKSGVPRDLALQLEEEHLDWPGVLVQVEAMREYLQGALTSHILGYMGPIPADQAEIYQAEGYDPNSDRVGLTGVEYAFEQELRGQNGHKLIEVDVAGREVRTVGEPEPVVPGYNLRLTLDLALQTKAQDVLSQHLKELNKNQGVVIAVNPQTGEILALVSLPAYDNNLFTGGISVKDLRTLQKDPARPLVNHAISGMFPPGSTFKLMVASGGLEEGVITADTRLNCGGILWLPNRYYPEDPSLAQPFYCWAYTSYGGSHGSLSLVQAIGQSCDIFFYQVGGGYRSYFQGLGEERLAKYAELFGLGAPTGIDLPGESAGLVPTPKWKRINYSESWTTGDTYNMCIGQGFVLATPLQMLNVAATVANGGTLYRPQVVREVLDAQGDLIRAFSPDVIRTVPVSPANLDLVRQGMRASVAGPGGTSAELKSLKVAAAGKTGTAEFFADENKDGLPDRDQEGNLPTHAWFVGFAPYDKPEIALVVFVYGGGQGSSVAVPIAREILTYYFAQERLEDQP